MKPNDAIKLSIDTADLVARSYLEDLTDEEMMHRPAAGCNHIKWQIGHLIESDFRTIDSCCKGSMPALPEGFAKKYNKQTASIDDHEAFHRKAELMELYDQQRSAILKTLATLTPEELEKPAPETMRSYAPTVAAAFSLLGIHWAMHAGQWAVIRRQLGRAPLF